jgi:tetraacyldisaccharide 4'-kinase
MRAPAFWWQEPEWQMRLLMPLSELYGRIVERRLDTTLAVEIGVPVLCVGNLTVGGTGKTPAAIAIARMLTAAGEDVFLLSRGYGGRLPGPLIVDTRTHRARDVGDEPLLLTRAATTVVARDRAAGAALARDSGATVIVMDDGFQNPSLVKHVSVLMFDSRRGIGNGGLFPAGPLRAPVEWQLDRTQAMIIVGDLGGAESILPACKARGIPVFFGRLEPDARAVAALANTPVLAFAGIGDPRKFVATLLEAGIPVRRARDFGDHHRYTRAQADGLIAEAERERLALVTTEKDLVRIRTNPRLAALAAAVRTVPVRLALHRPEEFENFVLDALWSCRHSLQRH